MRGKKLLVMPWRVHKDKLVDKDQTLLVYGRHDQVAGKNVASSLVDGDYDSHDGLRTETFETGKGSIDAHSFVNHLGEIIQQYREN